jgi:hypothetical protein
MRSIRSIRSAASCQLLLNAIVRARTPRTAPQGLQHPDTGVKTLCVDFTGHLVKGLCEEALLVRGASRKRALPPAFQHCRAPVLRPPQMDRGQGASRAGLTKLLPCPGLAFLHCVKHKPRFLPVPFPQADQQAKWVDELVALVEAEQRGRRSKRRGAAMRRACLAPARACLGSCSPSSRPWFALP